MTRDASSTRSSEAAATPPDVGPDVGPAPGSPLVSLIMPVWNTREEWLLEAVASALGQRGCAVELVVVDDGSDEPVADVLSPLTDDRLTVVRTGHLGASNARNVGLELARGTHMRFIDSDDVVTDRGTAHLLELMGDDDTLITYGSTLVCDEQLNPIARIETDVQGAAATTCLLNRFDVSIHSLLFPRAVVEAAGSWDTSLSVSEDWDFVLRALEHAPVRGDRAVATRYRTHDVMSSRDLAAGITGYRRVVERYFERHPELVGSALHRHAIADWHLFCAEQRLARDRAYATAFSHLGRAFPARPLRTLRLAVRLSASSLLSAVRGARVRP